MGKAGVARKLVAAAAYGGGGLSVVAGSLYGLLRAEAKIARKAIGNAEGDPPDSTGWYGGRRENRALEVVLLGDSSAAGYGVDHVQHTPGAHLASGLAEGADRPVHLRSYAKVGAQTRDLSGQLDRALPPAADRPEVAVILVGANDITHSRMISESVRELTAAVRRLREAGAEVVVGTCPDLGTIEPIPAPLRQLARAWSRQLAKRQAVAVVGNGGRTVSLATILGPEFSATPALLFGPDRFHPSAAGYSSLAAVLLPSVLAAVDVIPFADLLPEAARGDAILPITQAAAEASRTPGMELDGTQVAGSTRGTRGRWVQLRRRRRQPEGEVEKPQPAPA